MEKSLDEILQQEKRLKPAPQPTEAIPAEPVLLPVWEFTSDLVNTFMLNGNPVSLPYRTQNPFIAGLLNREYVFNGVLQVKELPPEPPKYISVRKGLR